MKQVLQNKRTGLLAVEDVPIPFPGRGRVLVRNVRSLISSGTERQSVSLGAKSLVGKALARPDQVRQVLEVSRREGLAAAYSKAMGTLERSYPLGYSCAGIVVEAGEGVAGFRPGMRVACAGAGYANHAEYVSVPTNLCVGVPDEVDFDDAAFATVGAIAIQSIRQADVSLGDVVVVVGLGLVGQLVAQLLGCAGCQVVGIDVDIRAVDLARGLGISAAVPGEDGEAIVARMTRGRGADRVIIAAGGGGNKAVELAAHLCRDRGTVVVIGDVGLDIPRDVFYEKELDLRLSRSYGPGRYDRAYEEQGIDYPVGYVRWTENRNMEAFLDTAARGQLSLSRLVTHRMNIEHAADAYEQMLDQDRPDRPIAVLLDYPEEATQAPYDRRVRLSSVSQRGSVIRIGVIGAGNFARGTLLPILKAELRVALVGVATASGSSGKDVAVKEGFSYCTTDYRDLLSDPDIDAVVIATRHDLHASIAIDALKANKQTFVEKPMALDAAELDAVVAAAQESSALLMVGHNRRFAPLSMQARDFVGGGPKVINCRINAGPLPGEHWALDAVEGGGRIIGEVCHFVDLLTFLCGSPPSNVAAYGTGASDDSVVIILQFKDGSVGSIAYTGIGDPAYPKERIEMFANGKVVVIDDFRRATFVSNGRQKARKVSQDKGHRGEVAYFIDALLGKGEPDALLQDSIAATRATLLVQQAIKTGCPTSTATPENPIEQGLPEGEVEGEVE